MDTKLILLSSLKYDPLSGLFTDRELAELVAMEARDKYHGTFACHN